MQEFLTCVVSKNGMAYLTGIVIFIITLFLAARQIIGFTLTLLFLIFALVAAVAVSNQDVIRSYFEHPTEAGKDGVYKSSSSSSAEHKNPGDINADLQRAFDDLKAEFLVEKERLQKIWEDFISRQSEKSEKSKKENQ